MLTLTESAQKAVSRFIKTAEQPVAGLRIAVTGGGFQFADPNAAGSCGCGKAFWA